MHVFSNPSLLVCVDNERDCRDTEERTIMPNVQDLQALSNGILSNTRRDVMCERPRSRTNESKSRHRINVKCAVCMAI